MPARSDWLAPLGEPPDLATGMARLRRSVEGVRVPTGLCRQCFDAEPERDMLAALRALADGQKVAAHRYARVFDEHPKCVGGEDTIRLVLPTALQDMWPSWRLIEPDWLHNIDVPDTALVAGLWYWPPEQIAALRDVAGRVFLDWIAQRPCALTADAPPEHREAISDDVLTLALTSLIDPVDLLEATLAHDTAEAMDMVTYYAMPSLEPPFYVAADIGSGEDDGPYTVACAQIAAMIQTRMAQAMVAQVSPDWTTDAVRRWKERDAQLARDLAAYDPERILGFAKGTPCGPKPALPVIE